MSFSAPLPSLPRPFLLLGLFFSVQQGEDRSTLSPTGKRLNYSLLQSTAQHLLQSPFAVMFAVVPTDGIWSCVGSLNMYMSVLHHKPVPEVSECEALPHPTPIHPLTLSHAPPHTALANPSIHLPLLSPFTLHHSPKSPPTPFTFSDWPPHPISRLQPSNHPLTLAPLLCPPAVPPPRGPTASCIASARERRRREVGDAERVTTLGDLLSMLLAL